MKKFQEFIFKDIGWKLLSIAIATILWSMVISIDQPVDVRSYTRPLSLKNMEVLTNRHLTINHLEEIKNTNITVKIKAQRTALDKLSQNPDWLQASVDFSELAYASSGDTVSLPVNVSVQGGNSYVISDRTPTSVDVTIEPLVFVEFPVELQQNGELPEDTYLSEPTLSTQTIIVSGPASVVKRVEHVRANVNAASIQNSPQVTATILCCDSNGVPVSGVITNQETITVSYHFLQSKEIPIQVAFTGTPLNGYEVSSIYCNPATVSLIGKKEVLESISFLKLDDVNVTDHFHSVTRTFDLMQYLPEGTSLSDDSNSMVQVTVNIEVQSQQQFLLPKENLTMVGQADNLTYTISNDAYVTIVGKELERLIPEELQGTLDVAELPEGEYKVVIQMDLPEGLILTPSYATVIVSIPEATQTEVQGG